MDVVYCKFKSGKEIFSVPVTGSCVSVSELKQLIMKSDRYGRGRTRGRGPREDLAFSNAQTGEEYADESTLIPKNSTVLIRRIAGHPSDTIVLLSTQKGMEDGSMTPNELVVIESAPKSSVSTELQDEDDAIRVLIDAAELKWDDHSSNRGQAGIRFTSGHHYGRGPLEGEMPPTGYVCRNCKVPGHFIRYCPLESKVPPPGYICRRCQVPGHFILHCPTNGDPRFDSKMMTRPLVPVVSASSVDGIPSELVPAASASVVDDLPAELHCRLCKKVMADAVLTSRCCFGSFCDKCIRNYIIAESKCICGVKVLADDLIPNQTLRSTISNMLATRASSTSSSIGKPRSSAGSNLDPKSQSDTPAVFERDMKRSMEQQLPSVTPEDGLQVTTQNDQVEQPQEKFTANVDFKSKTEGNSVGLPVQSKKKRKKAGPTESGHPNNAGYGYSIPFNPACYNAYTGGYHWGADPRRYFLPGMAHGAYPMGYGISTISNIPQQALAFQGYPDSYHGWQSQSTLHQDGEAAAHSGQAKRAKDNGLQSCLLGCDRLSDSTRGAESRSRSSECNQLSGPAHRTEPGSQSRAGSEGEHGCNDRASYDYDEDRHSRKKMRASSPWDGDRLSRRRSSHSSRSRTYEDSRDECNFKRKW